MKIITYIFICALFFTSVVTGERVTPTVKAIQQTEKAVVNIRTEKTVKRQINPFFNDPFFEDFFGFNRVYKTQSVGSGFVYTTDGIVVTNHHVIESASSISVILFDGTQYKATLLGADRTLDIAVLKVDTNKSFSAVNLGNSDDVLLGETVIAIGNPYGLNNSVTTGVISNKLRLLKNNYDTTLYIQTDTLINPGHSGGPLINLDGEVIGINSAIYKEAQGIGFSIPINTFKRVVDNLIQFGEVKKSYSGLTVEERDTGLVISKVNKKSAAYRNGIRKNDRILSLNHIPIGSKKAFDHILYSYPPGNNISVLIHRNGQQVEKTLPLTQFPHRFGIKHIKQKFGLVFREHKDFIEVQKSSIPAYIKKEDILIAINQTELNSLSDLNQILTEQYQRQVVFTLFRDGRVFKLKLEL